MNNHFSQIIILFLFSSSDIFGQNGSGCYITTRIHTSATDPTKSIEQRTYDNGLGDVSEEVQVGITPDGEDLVTLHEYDAFRRKVADWLPTANKGNGEYVNGASIASAAKNMYSDNSPFTTYRYDELEKDKISEQYRPGDAWRVAQKKIKTEYTFPFHIMMVTVPVSGILNFSGSSSLQTQRTTDEDGCVYEEHTDITGRKYAESTAAGTTYYVYDYRGDLVYVLPPVAAAYYEELHVNNTNYVYETDDMIQKYAYCYKYDFLHRCIYKKFPGCEPIYYIYDKAGNCVLQQDGNMRMKGKWLFTVPDIFGRLCVKGEGIADYSFESEPLHNVYVYAEYNGSSENLGYTFSGLNIYSPQILESNYYDDYSFISMSGRIFLNYASPPNGFPTADFLQCKGLLSGKAVAAINADGSPGYQYSAFYYDGLKQLIQTRSDSHRGGYEVKYVEHTYLGKPKRIYTTHTDVRGPVSELLVYTYDHAERVTRLTHQLNDGTVRVLYDNIYDQLGRVEYRNILGQATLSTHYTYNIQSAMKSITTGNLFKEELFYQDGSSTPSYNGNISSMIWQTGDGSTPLGNVKQRGYVFQYDKNSRLISDYYTENGSSNRLYDTSYAYDRMGNVTGLYRNGLVDAGRYDILNNLSYTYDGNRLISVSDSQNTPSYNGYFGFKDGVMLPTEYTYDANGNMTKDANKGIVSIDYDFHNLPQKLTYVDGSTVDYSYDAMGNKLRTSFQTNVGEILYGNAIAEGETLQDRVIDYCGNKIYKDGILRRILIPGGYISYESGGTLTYHAYLHDHQGNNRMVVDERGVVEQVSHFYPFGGLFGESSGGDVQRYKYNGKELDRMHGLDWYDYGARHYDAALARWTTMDPLCEKYYNVSPYAYCHNNPVKLVDPDGREVREGTGPYSKENAQLKLLAINLARQDDPNSIMIVAHGSSDYSFINIQTYNSKTGKWNDNLIHDGKEMNRFLSANSKVWQKYQEGKIEAKDLHIVLYSCYSTDVAKRISADEHFKDIPVIGADRKVITNGNSVRVGNTMKDKDGRMVDIRQYGQWHSYKNGQEPYFNGNYKGGIDLRPGTKNFRYETTWP